MQKRYPEISFAFYLPKRKKLVHMGLDMSLINYSSCLRILADIKDIWLSKKTDDNYKHVNPKLIHTSKLKFDCKVFEKNI